jgi:uncharacterized protein (TIGR02597 family)
LSGAAAGVTFKIRKHWSIATVFGPANEAGLGGGSVVTADKILLWDGTTYLQYYYQTTGIGGIGWRKSGAPTVNAANTVFYPEDGIVIQRLQSANVPVILMGAVKTGQTSIPVAANLNFVGDVYAAPLTLADSGLYTGNNATGLAGGSVTTADQVFIWNLGTNSYDIYYYQTVGIGGVGWRKSGAPAVDASGTQVPVGTSVVLNRKNAAGAFNWVIAQHPATL